MALLTTIVSALGGNLVDALLKNVTGVFESYFKKEISMEELRTRLQTEMLKTFSEVERSHADALAKTYDSFMGAVQKSKLMQVVWGAVVISQLGVLLWHQVGIPAFCYNVGLKSCYPSSGSTVEWAYLLIGAMCGLGPVMLRSGPGAGSVADRLKGLLR